LQLSHVRFDRIVLRTSQGKTGNNE